MKSLESLFNACLPCMLVACTQDSGMMQIVDSAAYEQADRCWFSYQQFEAFLVITKNGTEGVPYLISTKCIAGGYENFGASTLALVNAIKIRHSERLWTSSLGYDSVGDNLRSDLPLPASDDRVFFLRARLSRTDVNGIKAYDVESVSKMSDTGRTFAELLAMGPRERMRLARGLR